MALIEIPVTFEYKGKEYKGLLSQVSGAGSAGMYHLSVDGVHWGSLHYIEGHPGFNGGLHAVPAGWQFSSNQHADLGDQAEYFGYIVTAWLDSHS